MHPHPASAWFLLPRSMVSGINLYIWKGGNNIKRKGEKKKTVLIIINIRFTRLIFVFQCIFSNLHECLFDIEPFFCTGFIERYTVVTRTPLLSSACCDSSIVSFISLVGKNNKREGIRAMRSCLCKKLISPVIECIKRLGGGALLFFKRDLTNRRAAEEKSCQFKFMSKSEKGE